MITTNEINRLKASDMVCVDIETSDPDLIKKGPGTHRGKGFICGIGFGCKYNGKSQGNYLSITHPDTKPEFREKNIKIAKDLLACNNEKIGANIAYDIEWLEHEGYTVNGELHDIQFAEPLLNEYARSFSLDTLAKKYNVGVKRTDVLKDYNDHMGWEGKPIENIWKMPARVAREYTIGDVTLPLDIFYKQSDNLATQNLYDLYRLECELIPVMLKMRKNGVRLDMPLFKKTVMQVTDKHFQLKEDIYDWANKEFNIGSTPQLAKVFDAKGIHYPRNAPTAKMKEAGKKGNPNLDKAVLKKLAKQYPMCKTILDFRHYNTLINLFLSKYADFAVDDRLYCSFHPLRNDDYGTVSGRFSSSKPNLQQVSAKEEDSEDAFFDLLKGQILRKLFIPEEGHRWAKLDYSQVEYRMLAHYANGEGADELKASYNDDKNMDYHQRIMDLTGLERRPAKTINFGALYGMGAATTANILEVDLEEAEAFLNVYHTAAPYVRSTLSSVSNMAATRTFIFTLLGRKARIHPSRKLYSMFNRLIQGSSADVMKKAMVDANKKGLFEELILHLTVHDELDVSYKDDSAGNEALKELHETMENTVKLDVPILVDCHTGKNWAEAD